MKNLNKNSLHIKSGNDSIQQVDEFNYLIFSGQQIPKLGHGQRNLENINIRIIIKITSSTTLNNKLRLYV